eukprot:767198-Hanusia_phi.AAC.3
MESRSWPEERVRYHECLICLLRHPQLPVGVASPYEQVPLVLSHLLSGPGRANVPPHKRCAALPH